MYISGGIYFYYTLVTHNRLVCYSKSDIYHLFFPSKSKQLMVKTSLAFYDINTCKPTQAEGVPSCRRAVNDADGLGGQGLMAQLQMKFDE